MHATPVNKEEVRMLVADLGYQETEKRTGISANTLYQWANRFGWNKPIIHSQAVRTVRQSPADAHAEALREHERETRMSLARSARKLATEAERAGLAQAGNVHKAAQVAGIVHKWGSEEQAKSFTLNVLNMGSMDVEVGQGEA